MKLKRPGVAGESLCSAVPGSHCTAPGYDRQDPVTHTHGARVIKLDAPASIEARLSRRLPSDPKRAAAIVRQRVHAGGSALQHRLTTAYQGVTDAWSLGISEIPAVIVDGRYVVYGVPDVNWAVALIKTYRKRHR